MRQGFVFTLIWLVVSQSAYAICKLNNLGHNICTSEKALLKIHNSSKSENESSMNQKFTVVWIKKHIFRERHVIIKSKETGEQQVHIDDLVGNKLCENNDQACKGDKVFVREDCQKLNSHSKYKVSEKYENDVVELETGSLIFSKSFLTVDNCIDPVK